MCIGQCGLHDRLQGWCSYHSEWYRAQQARQEDGENAGILNRVHCHRQCHCKDSISEEGRWTRPVGLRMNPNSAKGDETNGLIPPKLSKIKVIVY